MKKIENILIISNMRMLLIYLLMFPNGLKNSLIIADDSIKLNLSQYTNCPIFKVRRCHSTLELIFLSLSYQLKFLLLYKKFDFSKAVVYGADHILGAKFFLKRFPFFLIEDGSTNYTEKTYNRTLKNRFFSIPSYGIYKTVGKIYLTKENNIPSIIKEKVSILNIEILWNSLSKLDQDFILKVFSISSDKLNFLRERKYILFTQPLSEDRVITENEKISLYQKILEKYNENELVIKPHPREDTDYSIFFKNAYILKEDIPSELLTCCGIDFEKFITLFSTAVMSYKKEKIDFYGTTIHPNLVKRFGIINSLSDFL